MEVFYPYWLSHMGTSWETFWHNWEIQLIIYLRLWKIQEVKFTQQIFPKVSRLVFTDSVVSSLKSPHFLS